MKLVCAKILHLAKMLVFCLKVLSSDQRLKETYLNLLFVNISQGTIPSHSNLNVFLQVVRPQTCLNHQNLRTPLSLKRKCQRLQKRHKY